MTNCLVFRDFSSYVKYVLPKYSFLFQVCIRVNEENYYRFDPFHVYGTYHELYHYNEVDCKYGSKIPGLTLPSTMVKHALETVKQIKEISSTLQKKESDIKNESEKMYKNFTEEIVQYHPPNTPCSQPKNVFSDYVSNEALKRVQSELMTEIDGKLIGFQDAERERFSEMKEMLQKIQDGLQKQA